MRGRRGGWIEEVFGYVKGGLGFGRWLLRGEKKVAQEGRLMALSYQRYGDSAPEAHEPPDSRGAHMA